MNKPKIHFTDKYLLQPTNPVTVNLIGAGGTGSQVLTALARINHSLCALGHAGLSVKVFDEDIVTPANLGRQLFTAGELGLNKGVALINRLNRFFGTNWKAVPQMYNIGLLSAQPDYHASITISCVDTIAARFEIAASFDKTGQGRDKPLYWCDFGNSQYTGQVVLATIGNIKQPVSKKYEPVGSLPFVTDEFKSLLANTDETSTPSCSLVEALTRQDLFINSALANIGASLLWQLFREGMTENRGFFINLKDFRTQPLKVA
jgi:PRTRC genetic system ThiF family protein